MIEARVPSGRETCSGCRGDKRAPLACSFTIFDNTPLGTRVTIVLCEECGRDAANAIGFMCIRDGGWSKLEPRKKKVTR